MTDCWRSTQKSSGASNKLHADFDIYPTEADLFARSNAWQFCNFDDCDHGHNVGFPRDCGAASRVAYNWHAFSNGLSGGKADVAFYVTTCNGWAPPVVDIEVGGVSGWAFTALLVAGALSYVAIGSAMKRRKHGTKRHWKEELPHKEKWQHLHALVLDGIAFAMSRGDVKGRNCSNGSARPSSASGDGSTRETLLKEKNKENKEKKEKKGKPTGGSKKGRSPKRASKSGNSSGDTRGSDMLGESIDVSVVETSTDVAAARDLREERDSAVHSSQAKIKIVIEA
eukprot:SAG11_NODE_3878_length_2172_cov_8.010613_1_plen_283_part_00